MNYTYTVDLFIYLETLSGAEQLSSVITPCQILPVEHAENVQLTHHLLNQALEQRLVISHPATATPSSLVTLPPLSDLSSSSIMLMPVYNIQPPQVQQFHTPCSFPSSGCQYQSA